MSKKCLIIDDVSVSRFVIQGYMEEMGFEAIDAEDLDAALGLLKTQSVDLIILDWHLRQQSALARIPDIRKLSTARATPILICSGVEQSDNDDGLLNKVKDSGAQGFIRKPITFEKFQDELRRLNIVS